MAFLNKKENVETGLKKLPKKVKIGSKVFELSFNQEVFVNIFCAVIYIAIYCFAESIVIKYYHGYEEWVSLLSASNIYTLLICLIAVVSALALGFISAVANTDFNNLRDLFKLLFSGAAICQLFLGVYLAKAKVASFWNGGTYTQYIVQADTGYTELLKATSGAEITTGGYVILLIVFMVLFTNSGRDV